MTLSQPIRFGKYLLLDKIAVDGKAEFYKAKLAASGGVEKPIMIKRILPQLAAEKGLIKSFMNKAKIGAFLKHDNIIRIYDVGTTDDAYFVAMEYVFGKNLQVIDSTSKEKGLPISLQAGETLAEVGGQAALGLVDYGGAGGQVLILSDLGSLDLYDFGHHERDNFAFLRNLARYARDR